MRTEEAIFAAGCFWGVESAFRKIKGVLDAEAGYTGGSTENPTYEEVCTAKTGHAEAVRVVFDPDQVSYESLVRAFFDMHDPTALNRQGPDVGEQYRSVLFFLSEEQEKTARRVKAEEGESGRYAKPIVTSIEPAGPFFRAEEYHQRYFEKRGGGVCHG